MDAQAIANRHQKKDEEVDHLVPEYLSDDEDLEAFKKDNSILRELDEALKGTSKESGFGDIMDDQQEEEANLNTRKVFEHYFWSDVLDILLQPNAFPTLPICKRSKVYDLRTKLQAGLSRVA